MDMEHSRQLLGSHWKPAFPALARLNGLLIVATARMKSMESTLRAVSVDLLATTAEVCSKMFDAFPKYASYLHAMASDLIRCADILHLGEKRVGVPIQLDFISQRKAALTAWIAKC